MCRRLAQMRTGRIESLRIVRRRAALQAGKREGKGGIGRVDGERAGITGAGIGERDGRERSAIGKDRRRPAAIAGGESIGDDARQGERAGEEARREDNEYRPAPPGRRGGLVS